MKLQSIKSDELGPSDFSTAITRIAVAQICQSVGFKAAHQSVLETLTDIAARYLRSLAKSAASSANSTGRTQSNLLDIVVALEELRSVVGFRGASNVRGLLYHSSTLADIMKFVKYTREIPFAKPVPRHKFPLILPPKLGNAKCMNARLGNHIPRWLPEIPEISEKDRVVGSSENHECEKNCLDAEKTVVKRKEMKRWELPGKRARVSFKMGVVDLSSSSMNEVGGERFGVDLRSGVCRGGKRISCQTWRRDDEGAKC